MTEALFFELLTTTPEHRSRCFSRLPSTHNPVVLVPNVGAILRWEVHNQEPVETLSKIAMNDEFRFNPDLGNPKYEIGSAQTRDLVEWRNDMEGRVQQFADHASTIPQAFPELANYCPGQEASRIEEAKSRICTEREFVRSFYHNEDAQWPSFDTISEEWAIYRWLQIRVLAALDYFKKHGVMKKSGKAKAIENEYLDLEYCLVACLCGGLATRDHILAGRFMALCVKGKLLQ